MALSKLQSVSIASPEYADQQRTAAGIPETSQMALNYLFKTSIYLLISNYSMKAHCKTFFYHQHIVWADQVFIQLKKIILVG